MENTTEKTTAPTATVSASVKTTATKAKAPKATATVKKTTTKRAATRKTTTKKATPAVKTTVVEAKIDTTKAVNAVANAANEVEATSKDIKNVVVKTVNNVNKKVTATVNDVNKKVASSARKFNKEAKETASEISATTSKLANEVVESLKVNERIANVRDVVLNPNKHALKAADNMIDTVEKNTIKWQKVADKAVTTGLKLVMMQEELVFSSLEAVKTHVGTTAMRVKHLFGMDKQIADRKLEVKVTAKSTKKA